MGTVISEQINFGFFCFFSKAGYIVTETYK